MAKGNVDQLVERYKKKLEEQLGHAPVKNAKIKSRDYQHFRKESMPAHVSTYERLCKQISGLLKLKVTDPKKAAELKEHLRISHLQITPDEAFTFSILLPVLIMLSGVLISVAIGQLFFAGVSVLFGLILMGILAKWPGFVANAWRMKASNQMVLCIFYVVTYMRHTSNLELAIKFAAEHLAPPLSTDLTKVVWDVETETYSNIKDSLDSYLETWRNYNKEFIEAFHMIESSLFEGDNTRRLGLLDKSLDVMLSETYEKMLSFAHNLKGPITMLHMMGVILPVLGLVILPLVVSFMEGVKWYHIATLYNLFLPLAVYTLSKNILATRPTGYGASDISETNPELNKYKTLFKIGKTEVKLNPKFIAISIFVVLFSLALSPLIIHMVAPGFDVAIGPFKLLEYRESSKISGLIIGPFGMGATLLSLLFPLSFALSLGIYYKMKSNNVLEIRDKTKQLENEFASALFQLGNRLGDGMPAEAAFGRVAEVMDDSASGQFFNLVSTNIKKLGMGLNDAIFNERSGAIRFFPSNIIESSMKVLTESIKKGPMIAAQALQNVARYVKQIHQVNQRLKDLMADIISDIKSQIKFLAPAISAIVIGITSMITTILGALSGNMAKLQEGGGQISGLSSMFGDGIPTYYFQLVVGIYIVQIIYILTTIANGVENGADKLGEEYALGQNLIMSVLLYVAIATTVMLIFNGIATQILGAMVS